MKLREVNYIGLRERLGACLIEYYVASMKSRVRNRAFTVLRTTHYLYWSKYIIKEIRKFLKSPP